MKRVVSRVLFLIALFFLFTGFDSGQRTVVVCEGSTVILHAQAAGAVAYQWYKNGQQIAGATGKDYIAAESGQYSVMAFNSSSCASEESDITTVKVLSLPSIQFTPLPGKTYGEPPFTLEALALNNDGPVRYTASPEGIVRIDVNKVTILNAGTVEITAIAEGPCGPSVSAKQALKINPASLVVSADAKTKYYGDENPGFTVSYSGLVNGDETAIRKLTSAALNPVCFAGSKAGIGVYPITLSPVNIPNYKAVFEPGQLRIEKRPLTVTANDHTKTRDGKLCEGHGVTYSGFVPGENEGLLNGALKYSGSAMTALSPGRYTIETAGLEAVNYDIRYVAGTLTILDRYADIAVIKTSDSKPVRVGDSFDYKLKVENKGSEIASVIAVKDILPEGVEFVSITEVSEGISTYDQSKRSLMWQIPQLLVNASAELRFVVKAISRGKIINVAEVNLDETDSNLSDNRSSDIKDINGIMIPNVFTPNGDEMNETFKIPRIADFQENQLEVFDRTGNMVYQKKNYRNEWNADSLSEGTYFYVLNVKNGAGKWDAYKGYVTLLRSNKRM